MSKQFHLPGLNGIRAIAALIVVFCHIDQFSPLSNLPSLGISKNGTAAYGVVLFFVLSGYLITYLLLLEKEKFKTVDLLKFYKRRILRIWPIYYLIILITFCFLMLGIIDYSGSKLSEIALFYSFFLSNIGYGLGLGLITITPLWSVGVEEQFYFFWPFLIKSFKRIGITLICVLGIYLIIKLSFRLAENGTIYKIIRLTTFSSMAIGGLGAYIVYKKSSLLKFVFNNAVQVLAWLVFIYIILIKPLHLFEIIDYELHSVIFVVLIINVSTNPKTLLKLENRFFNYIGKISYGIYIYHMLVILFVSIVFKKLNLSAFENIAIAYVLLYILQIGAAIFLAHISYQYFESFFLSWKTKYANIESSADKKM